MTNLSEMLRNQIYAAEKIFFVCSGNIIRSSFAHLYAQHIGVGNVDSFGTRYHNQRIHNRSAQELEDLGVNPTTIQNFKPKHIDDIDLQSNSTIFFVMTSAHKNDLLSYKIPSNRIFLITEILGLETEIADPYFEGNYTEAYSTIREAINQLGKNVQ